MRWFALGLLSLATCVASSTQIGVLEQASSSSSSATTGDATQCLPGCTAPYAGGFACGDSPKSELDEQCCQRPYCDGDADCPSGTVCNYGGLYGFGCEEIEQDGESVCQCGANPLALGRPMCIPPSAVDPDWCAQLRNQSECEQLRSPIDFGDAHPRICRWVAIEEVRSDGETCTIVDSLPRCLTLIQPDGNGCSPAQCTLDDTALNGPLARPLDATSYEMIVAGDVLCGVGTPLEDWIPADDPSLGPCAAACE